MWTLIPVAAAAELQVDCSPGNGETLELAGVPPFEVRCAATLSDGTLAEDTEWLFGDGTFAEGATVSHVYEDVGRYPITVEFVGELPAGEDPDTSILVVRGEVAVCGPPTPSFATRFRGDLSYWFVNTSPPDPGCVADLRWDLFEGDGQNGPSVATVTTWDAAFDIPDTGTWTVVLSMGGIGGVAASASRIEAERGRTDAYKEIGLGCSTLPVTAGSVGAWIAAAALLRRKRR